MRGLGAHVPSPFILHVVYVVLRCKRSLCPSYSRSYHLDSSLRRAAISSLVHPEARKRGFHSLSIASTVSLSFLPFLERGVKALHQKSARYRAMSQVISLEFATSNPLLLRDMARQKISSSLTHHHLLPTMMPPPLASDGARGR